MCTTKQVTILIRFYTDQWPQTCITVFFLGDWEIFKKTKELYTFPNFVL